MTDNLCEEGICICPSKFDEKEETWIDEKATNTTTIHTSDIDRNGNNVGPSNDEDDYEYIADRGIDWSGFPPNPCPRYS